MDDCGAPPMDFLQPQPALLSPHLPMTGFVMNTHFRLEKMLFGHRHSQNEGTVSESFPGKGRAKASAMP